MARKVFYYVLMAILLGSCGSTAQKNPGDAISLNEAIAKSAADIMKKVPPNSKIAFFNISETEYSNVTNYVIEEISAVLVDKAKLIVVDRSNMDVIDAEHEFQASGRVSDDDVISVAKKFGATSVASCSVSGQFDLRRLRVRALDVETGQVLSLTSHSVQNISDYAQPQTAAPTRNTQPAAVAPAAQPEIIAQPVAVATAVLAASEPISLQESDWYSSNMDGTTHYYRFQAGRDQSYFIEWRDSDSEYSDSYADLVVGIQRDGNSSYIVPVSDDGNYALNKHQIRTTPGQSYIIAVQGFDSGSGRYALRVYPEIVYQIGERGPAGGIIFYDKGNSRSGWRYLEAAPADKEIRNLKWGTYRQSVSGTQMDLGSGQQNTQLIIYYAQAGNESGTAAQTCARLNIGGATDWFLPSREELYMMYLNLHSKGLGGFKNERYWSSSQVDSNRAWYLHFGDKGRPSHDKDKNGDGLVFRYDILVRAIRAF